MGGSFNEVFGYMSGPPKSRFTGRIRLPRVHPRRIVRVMPIVIEEVVSIRDRQLRMMISEKHRRQYSILRYR